MGSVPRSLILNERELSAESQNQDCRRSLISELEISLAAAKNDIASLSKLTRESIEKVEAIQQVESAANKLYSILVERESASLQGSGCGPNRDAAVTPLMYLSPVPTAIRSQSAHDERSPQGSVNTNAVDTTWSTATYFGLGIILGELIEAARTDITLLSTLTRESIEKVIGIRQVEGAANNLYTILVERDSSPNVDAGRMPSERSQAIQCAPQSERIPSQVTTTVPSSDAPLTDSSNANYSTKDRSSAPLTARSSTGVSQRSSSPYISLPESTNPVQSVHGVSSPLPPSTGSAVWDRSYSESVETHLVSPQDGREVYGHSADSTGTGVPSAPRTSGDPIRFGSAAADSLEPTASPLRTATTTRIIDAFENSATFDVMPESSCSEQRDVLSERSSSVAILHGSLAPSDHPSETSSSGRLEHSEETLGPLYPKATQLIGVVSVDNGVTGVRFVQRRPKLWGLMFDAQLADREVIIASTVHAQFSR
ncbi:hypothetical protein C8R43DRAFT_1141850 [Mycena crocata]|nr:hypothetical protein C8R43DRAFT_1141850 [Mycena crocata]